MGHYCRICGRVRANEQFSGKGHRTHICKHCQKKPKNERQAIEDANDISGFMEQSHISQKNVARLEQMKNSQNPEIAHLAGLVLEVARLKPYRKKRIGFLAHRHPELLHKLNDAGLIFVEFNFATMEECLSREDDEGMEAPAVFEDLEFLSSDDQESRDSESPEDWDIPF
jgi:hypothetical protein